MPIMVNVLVFRTLAAEAASAINVNEVVSSSRTVVSKRNLGYGFNVGNASVIPSQSYVIDTDWYDAPVFAPTIQGGPAWGF